LGYWRRDFREEGKTIAKIAIIAKIAVIEKQLQDLQHGGIEEAEGMEDRPQATGNRP
jgi:hypothetical protein